MERRSLLALSGASLSLAATGALLSPARANEGVIRPVQAKLSPEAQLHYIIKRLEELPEYLKNADPRTYPNYSQEINKYLSGVTVIVYPPDHNLGRINWWACAAALASLAIEYGIPAGKILKWLKDSVKIWRSLKGVIQAIKTGEAANRIGHEAVKVLEGVLGIDSVVAACS